MKQLDINKLYKIHFNDFCAMLMTQNKTDHFGDELPTYQQAQDYIEDDWSFRENFVESATSINNLTLNGTPLKFVDRVEEYDYSDIVENKIIFSIGENLFQLEIGYASYDGFFYEDANVYAVEAVTKTIEVYERKKETL